MSWVTDLDFIARQAQANVDDYIAFGYYIELDERTDTDLDTLIDQIANPIIDGIDCTQCGNCCRSLDVYLEPSDAKRLSSGTQILYETLVNLHIDQDRAAAVDEWGVFKHKPCVFLEGKICSIYEYRPNSCREYPVFTPDFRWTVQEVLGGVGLCPIIYNMIEQLKIELGW